MIIKSLSRKDKKRSTVKQLLTYFTKEYKLNDFVITHNINGNTISQYTDAFMNNERNRLHIRKNNVLVYHDIISMHPLDGEKISKMMLRSIAKEYIKFRNPHAIYVIVPHYDRQSIHLHVAMSGVELYTGLATRVTKEEFQKIKNKMQDKFPKLEHSIVNHGKKEQQKISEKEFQMKKRKVKTEKEITKELLESVYKQSISKADFYKRIKEKKLKIYERNSKMYGIEGKRKMRFSTLGFNEKKLDALEIINEFQNIREKNIGERELHR